MSILDDLLGVTNIDPSRRLLLGLADGSDAEVLVNRETGNSVFGISGLGSVSTRQTSTLFTGAGVVLALHHLSIPTEWEKIWSLSVQLFVACWVCLDRKDHRLSLPFEAFVFFALPFALPYCLYKSRGARRGILLSVFIFGLVLVPGLVASVLESVLESVLRLI